MHVCLQMERTAPFTGRVMICFSVKPSTRSCQVGYQGGTRTHTANHTQTCTHTHRQTQTHTFETRSDNLLLGSEPAKTASWMVWSALRASDARSSCNNRCGLYKALGCTLILQQSLWVTKSIRITLILQQYLCTFLGRLDCEAVDRCGGCHS